MGLPLDTALKLKSRFADAQGAGTGLPDLPAALERALKRRPDVLALADAFDLSKLSFDLAKKYYTPNVYAYRQAELDLRGAELALSRKKADVDFEARAAHAVMQDAAERLVILRKAVEQAREGFRVANLMYEKGLSTSQDMAVARVGLLRAETQVSEALFDYNLARSRFGIATAEGLE